MKKSKIEEAVEYIFRNQKIQSDRKITGFRSCNTYGIIEIQSSCKNTNCKDCENFRKLFLDEVNDQMKILNND